MKIIVALSGGVDSAVAAYLLKKQGHDVIGLFMRNWDPLLNHEILGYSSQKDQSCTAEKDWKEAVQIAKQIGIKIYRKDFVQEYWNYVFQDFIKTYKQGHTPNPDVWCNKYIKFGTLLDYVEKEFPQVKFLASGHYAHHLDGLLQKPKDKEKDQTYFLAQVPRSQIKKVIFPLADLTKKEVRKIARANHLIVADKKDSTGICFIGERKFQTFLKNYIPAQPGLIMDIRNQKIVGKHQGAIYYTIGQRKGLNLGGMIEPYYVVGHNVLKKIVYVAPQSERQWLLSNKAIIKKINWLYSQKQNLDDLEVKFRYRSKAVSCRIKWINENSLQVLYPDKFEGVTPGQHAVFYQKKWCLGGGVISKVYDDLGEKTYL